MALENTLITSELATRKSRPPDIFAERRALNVVARRMSFGQEAVLQALCELAIELCAADSAGISVLRETDEDSEFSWDAVAGALDGHLGGKAPRHHSPCGVCLALGAPQLFSHPERHFEWMLQASLPVTEGLVIPLFKKDRTPYGTIWILLHDESRAFDSEDVRVMTALGGHAIAALQMIKEGDGWHA